MGLLSSAQSSVPQPATGAANFPQMFDPGKLTWSKNIYFGDPSITAFNPTSDTGQTPVPTNPVAANPLANTPLPNLTPGQSNTDSLLNGAKNLVSGSGSVPAASAGAGAAASGIANAGTSFGSIGAAANAASTGSTAASSLPQATQDVVNSGINSGIADTTSNAANELSSSSAPTVSVDSGTNSLGGSLGTSAGSYVSAALSAYGLYSATQDKNKLSGAANGWNLGGDVAGLPGAIIGAVIGYGASGGVTNDRSDFVGTTTSQTFDGGTNHQKNWVQIAGNPAASIGHWAGVGDKTVVANMLNPLNVVDKVFGGKYDPLGITGPHTAGSIGIEAIQDSGNAKIGRSMGGDQVDGAATNVVDASWKYVTPELKSVFGNDPKAMSAGIKNQIDSVLKTQFPHGIPADQDGTQIYHSVIAPALDAYASKQSGKTVTNFEDSAQQNNHWAQVYSALTDYMMTHPTDSSGAPITSTPQPISSDKTTAPTAPAMSTVKESAPSTGALAQARAQAQANISTPVARGGRALMR